MRVYSVSSILAFMLLVGTAAAQQNSEPVSLAVEALDFESQTSPPLPGDQVTVRLNLQGASTVHLMPASQNNNTLSTTLPRNEVCNSHAIDQTLGLQVGAEGDWMPRNVRLYVNLICEKGVYTYKIHLVKHEPSTKFNLKYVQLAQPMLSPDDADDADAALAYLTRAMDELRQNNPEEPSMYACLLRDYYLIALQQTCKLISYATCDEARSTARELSKSQVCLNYLHKRPDYYQTVVADVSAKEATVAAAEGDLQKALDQWTAIIEISKDTNLARIGLSESRIKTGQGITYMKLGMQRESKSRSNAAEYYANAEKSLSSITEPDPLVRDHEAVLKERIAATQGQGIE